MSNPLGEVVTNAYQAQGARHRNGLGISSIA
jgi:hypothetical protein